MPVTAGVVRDPLKTAFVAPVDMGAKPRRPAGDNGIYGFFLLKGQVMSSSVITHMLPEDVL